VQAPLAVIAFLFGLTSWPTGLDAKLGTLARASGIPMHFSWPSPGTQNTALPVTPLNVRICLLFGCAAGMGHGTVSRGPDGLRVLPQITG
jgi:hypothetical protein